MSSNRPESSRTEIPLSEEAGVAIRPSDRPRSPLRALVAPVYLPSVIYAVGSGAVNPVLALAALAIGFDHAGSSAVVGVFGMVGIVLSPPVGRFITRIGDRAALIAGSFISLAALAVSLWALWYGASGPARAVYVTAVVLLSLGANIWSLARQAYIAESIPGSYRARAMSTLGGMVRLGVLVGPLAATAVLAVYAVNAVFVVEVVTVLISLALVVAFVVPEPSVDTRVLEGDDAAAAQFSFDATKRSSNFATVVMGVGLNALTVLRANRNVIVPLWGTFLGLPARFITATFAVTALLDASMFFISGILMDKRGRLWALMPSLIIMPAAIAVMVLWQSVPGFVLGAALLGFGNGFGSGIVMTIGADLAPATNKASFFGVWQAIVAIGTASGPFIVSGLTAAISLAAGMWATVIIGVAGTAWFALLIKPAYARLGMDLRGRPLPQPARERS